MDEDDDCDDYEEEEEQDDYCNDNNMMITETIKQEGFLKSKCMFGCLGGKIVDCGWMQLVNGVGVGDDFDNNADCDDD